MRRMLLMGLWLAALSGCQSETVPPPSPARVPGQYERRLGDEGQSNVKPLPDDARDDALPPPPFNDVPLVSQEAPETPPYVSAYEHVGRPRIVVWVTRPLGRARDENAARAIDYAAMENILIDWLSGGGRVAVISPAAARQALTPSQVLDLNSGRPADTQGVATKLGADVLVLVQAGDTQQAAAGPALRLVADASNLRGGESLGRAVVDVPAPLDKPQINQYTRFVARKLMADMTNAWNAFGAPAAEPAPPQTAPAQSPAEAAPADNVPGDSAPAVTPPADSPPATQPAAPGQ